SEALGSSDMAAVVGFSRWQSKPSVWYRKIEPTGEDNDSSIMQELGHELEPFIDRHFQAEAGISTCDPGDFAIYRSVAHPVIACTPDRLTLDGCPVELKTASFESAKAWKENVPIDYKL